MAEAASEKVDPEEVRSRKVINDNDLYDKNLSDNKEAIESLANIFERLKGQNLYLEKSKSIIKLAQFKIARMDNQNPMPPGLNEEKEEEITMNYIKNNIIILI